MRVIAGWRGLGPGDRGAATAIGNFDGVHRGHQQVIAAAAEAAGRLGAPLAAAIFSPHPRHWFQPEAPPFRLMTDAQRARALAALGVERLHVLPFDADMAAMTDAEFAQRVLAGAGSHGFGEAAAVATLPTAGLDLTLAAAGRSCCSTTAMT